LADFIVIASRLLLIKSKSLLPDFELTGEEEEAVRDLERRLTLYRAFRPAMRHVARLAREANWEFSRPYFLAMNRAALPGYFGGEAPFYPPKGMGAEVCAEAFGRLVRELQKLTRDAETIKEKITSIEETIEEVVRRLTKTAETRFSVLARRRSRAEILAVFLALLHLAREQMIRVEQEGHFADIMVRKNKSISE
jgi:segregation and condensation protein A